MKNNAKSLYGPTASRRTFLQRLAAASIALPTLPGIVLSADPARAADANTGQIQIANPIFSRAERDRRWAAVRRAMAKPQWNLDAILAPTSGDTAYPRYLTQIGGRGGSADVIFARDEVKARVCHSLDGAQ